MGMNALEVRRRVMLAQPHEAVAVGAVASFRTDVLSPLKMSFDLLPIQAGTGDPSPENVRPITGHDGFTRNGAGINLLNPDINLYSVKHAYLVNNYVVPEGATARMTITNKDTSVDASGCYIGFIESPYNGGGSPAHFNWCINNGSISSNLSNKHQGVACCGVFLYPSTQETFDKLFSRYNIMVELGSVAHDFEPYTGHSYETTFPDPPGTVYGGHVTDNGDGTYDLTVTRAMVGGSAWEQYNQSNGFKAYRINGVPVPNAASATGMSALSNMIGEFGSFNSSSMTKNIIQPPNPSAPNVYMALSSDVSASDVWFTYLLNTPIVYTLSLTALQSLIGQNHVWVDNADSVSVEYWGH